ncbi:hypothetical protein [Coraliomargarita parva]|uniref:hypothetical protein n=1 Tax=Coraliomargarita parva TaxID=3014050 RepID=UPI0022B5049D|nr:hypothetical protein [Coraliomargarita parva]
MQLELKSLRSARRMPIPRTVRADNYGELHAGHPHDVRLFRAVIREREQVKVDPLLESGDSTCYFHPKLPATALCDLSGRLICDLCRTEWEGQTVSFEALHQMAGKKNAAQTRNYQTQWDVIAMSTALLPLLIWPMTVVTAPLALFFTLWKWKSGPASPVRKSRWRFVVAGLCSILQLVGWGFFFFGVLTDG